MDSTWVAVGWHRTVTVTNGVHQSAGTCQQCGQPIKNTVTVLNTTTGETLDVGTECAATLTGEHPTRTSRRGHHDTHPDSCRCLTCQPVTHGTVECFNRGCREPGCVTAATSTYSAREHLILIDLTTGHEVPGSTITPTRHGLRWKIPTGTNQDVTWLPFKPARRSTLTRHGYTEAEATSLFTRPRSWGTPPVRLHTLTWPTVDRWGEPLTAQANR